MEGLPVGVDSKQLFETHVYLAEKVAGKYLKVRKPGVDFEDLHQEALFALHKASLTFNPSFDYGFNFYAVRKMSYAVINFLYNQNFLRTSRHIIETAMLIKRHKMLDWSVADIAQELNLLEKNVEGALAHLNRKFPKCIHEPVFVNSDNETLLIDVIADDSELSNEWVVDFKNFIESLDPRTKQILQLRLDGLGQDEIGKIIGLSQMQVSRIIKKAKVQYDEFMNVS